MGTLFYLKKRYAKSFYDDEKVGKRERESIKFLGLGLILIALYIVIVLFIGLLFRGE